MADSFATRARLDVNGTSYAYASLPRSWASASTSPACPTR
jgi:hypothetical protein